MANAENAKLQYEGGQTSSPMGALSNSGDAKTFTSNASLWSRRSGYDPVIRPDGLATGGVASVAVSGSDDVVDLSALTAYIGGSLKTVSAQTDLSVTRGASTNTHCITSITVTGAGSVSMVAGTASTAFSETRGAAGGAPYIPVGSIEIGQVRTTSIASAPIQASEIFQVVGLHTERTDFPIYDINYYDGEISFAAALPSIHTGDAPKGVFASYAEPIFADVAKSSDFVPSENSYSLNSTQIYGTTIGSTSATLNQASFTAYLEDGVTDALVSLKGESLWFRFYPDKFKTANILEQGKLGISRTFPAGDEIQASCTISTASAGIEVSA